MRVLQKIVEAQRCTLEDFAALAAINPQLVLAFGSGPALQQADPLFRQLFPNAQRLGCSTAGEISARGVSDKSLVVIALAFEHTRVVQASTALHGMADSFEAGRRLVQSMAQDDLRAILVFGQGVDINGSAVLAGMADILGPDVPISGGLAGDGAAFLSTWILDNSGASQDRLVCVGLYGKALEFSQGSFGGWSAFGPARKVTRCENNVLYALDGEPALALYKRYLGEYADGLPAAGLLFPFAMLGSDHNELGLIRTVLSVDESQGSLTLAGDIDPDGYLRLMHASTDALVDGAEVAAQATRGARAVGSDGFALLVSCVGRKLVMGDRVEEEVEVVQDVFGAQASVAGFYSYGEISPLQGAAGAKLHNQTMTITWFSESLGVSA